MFEKKTIFLLGILLFVTHVGLFSQTIKISGAPWNVNITPPALAGENPINNIESLSDQISINVHGDQDNNWQITVEKDATNWHSNLTLEVRRTGDGTGSGTISGGTTYVTIPDSPTYVIFFVGNKNPNNIPCQYRLHSDDLCPEASYSTPVIYTITNAP